MPTYRATYETRITLTVEVDAADEHDAADESWGYAQAYLDTLPGDHLHVVGVDASLDGIGADSVEERAPVERRRKETARRTS
jgi:hypothetical protein